MVQIAADRRDPASGCILAMRHRLGDVDRGCRNDTMHQNEAARRNHVSSLREPNDFFIFRAERTQP